MKEKEVFKKRPEQSKKERGWKEVCNAIIYRDRRPLH
jgi:hypothetical protein